MHIRTLPIRADAASRSVLSTARGQPREEVRHSRKCQRMDGTATSKQLVGEERTVPDREVLPVQMRSRPDDQGQASSLREGGELCRYLVGELGYDFRKPSRRRKRRRPRRRSNCRSCSSTRRPPPSSRRSARERSVTRILSRPLQSTTATASLLRLDPVCTLIDRLHQSRRLQFLTQYGKKLKY